MRTPVVTHWNGGFSQDGMCTDEFTNRHGGVGISVELGQAGMDSYQIAEGFKLGLYAIDTVCAHFSKRTFDARRKDVEEAPIFTWSQVIDFPEGEVELRPGLSNFQKLAKGEVIGTVDGNDIELEFGGRILFPKYWDKDSGKKRPAELIRIMKKVRLGELPQSDVEEETVVETAARIQKEKKAEAKAEKLADVTVEADVEQHEADATEAVSEASSEKLEMNDGLPRNEQGVVLQ